MKKDGSYAKHFQLYYNFVCRHKLSMIVSLVLFAVHTFIETIATGSVYPLINSILNSDGKFQLAEGQGVVLSALVNLNKMLPIEDEIVSSSVLVLVFSVLSAVLGFFSEFHAKKQQLSLYEVYKNKVFHILLHQPFSYFLNSKHGNLMFLGTNTANSAGEFFVFFPRTAVEVFRVFAFSAFLFSISFKATFFLFMFLGIVAVVFLSVSNRIIYPRSKLMNKYGQESLEIFSESMSGIKEIKTFNSTDFFYDKFKEKTFFEKHHYIISNIFSISFRKMFTIFAMILMSGVIIYGRMNGEKFFFELLPIVAVYVVTLQKIIPAVSNLSTNWMGLKELTPRLERLFEFLKREKEVEKTEGDSVVDVGDIEINKLDFSYDGNFKVLKNLHLNIPKRHTVAFVGSSGSGKSTLVSIMTGLFTQDSGEILVNGRDLRNYNIKSWRDQFAVVNQDTFLFHLSILDNIKMSNPHASFDEVVSASKQANAHEFINSLELGYETILGDKGSKVSGGQKQRIAIARALLKKPKVLFLDEATSALDNVSERYIKETLHGLKGELTVIIVAHRLSTIIDADRIYVFNQGCIIEEGQHLELLEKKGHYFNLYRSDSAHNMEQ